MYGLEGDRDIQGLEHSQIGLAYFGNYLEEHGA
jgi:hypothetical protein